MAGEALCPKILDNSKNLAIPSDFTGQYSRFSYDASLGYVALLKERTGKAGDTDPRIVPVLDDDFNFMQLSLLAQFRRIGSTFIGDGSPDNGWNIAEYATNNSLNFTIKAGTYILDGWILKLASDTTYSGQPNYSAASLPSLTAPGASRSDMVYLDVWLNETSVAEDPYPDDVNRSIKDPTIGHQTSTRLQLFWAVRVAENATVTPANGVDNAGHYHWYSPLALLTRNAGASITAAEITDLRRKTYSSSDVVTQQVPTGAIFYFPGTVAPNGYSICDGSLQNRSGAYASLWSYAQNSGTLVTEAEWSAGKSGGFSSGDGSSTFRLPKLTDTFIRGSGPNRGTPGTTQTQSVQSHSHSISVGNAASASIIAKGTSDFGMGSVETGLYGGAETRPANTALLPCIKL